MIARARAKTVDAEWWRAATHAAWIMNMWAAKGRRIRPAQLLGRPSKSLADFGSIAEARAYAEQMEGDA